jgi:hypothetical protein
MRAAAMTRPRPAATLIASIAVFVAVLVLLAWQVRAGRDPALGTVRQTARVAPAPRRVLVKKVVRRVIVTKVIHTDDGPVLVASTAPAPTSSGSVSYSAPAVSYSAPAPAPAPAAPVVTKSS